MEFNQLRFRTISIRGIARFPCSCKDKLLNRNVRMHNSEIYILFAVFEWWTIIASRQRSSFSLFPLAVAVFLPSVGALLPINSFHGAFIVIVRYSTAISIETGVNIQQHPISLHFLHASAAPHSALWWWMLITGYARAIHYIQKHTWSKQFCLSHKESI